MCCNNRRRNGLNGYGNYGAYNSCGYRSTCRVTGSTNIAAIVGALQQIRLDSKQSQQEVPQVTQVSRSLGGQTQDVTYLTIPNKESKIKHDAVADFEKLPSYEESLEQADRAVPSPAAPFYDPITTSNTTLRTSRQQEPQNQTVALGLQHFNAGLEAYRLGNKKAAKRAAKSFMRDLYDQEVEKRRAISDDGYLECGERKEIRHELKPLKQMMKEAVREAKTERRMQRHL